MAKKIKTCSICGQEIPTGFLRGKEQILAPASDILIGCCPDCYRRHKAEAEEVHDQLTAKVKNYLWKKRITLLPTEQQQPMYEQYRRERMALQAGRAHIRTEDYISRFFRCNTEGYFRWHEANISKSTEFRKEKVNVIKDGFDANKDVYHRDDMQFIRYRVTSFDPLGVFTMCCTVEMCVNEIDTVTAKPQATRFVVTCKGMLWSLKKKCRREARALVEEFRAAIGSTLPIEEVKKFR